MANFKKSSRYSNREIETDRSGQQFIVLRQQLNLEPADGDIYVTLTQQLLQRPDLIADRIYGNRELWWVIYEFNNISDPLFELVLGQILRIPSAARVQEALSPR